MSVMRCWRGVSGVEGGDRAGGVVSVGSDAAAGGDPGGFSKRLKSWTNRWAAKGVRVRRGDESDLALLVALMARTGARQGFAPAASGVCADDVSGAGALGQVAVFVGEVGGVAVSADVVTVCAGMVRGRLGGFDRFG